MRDMGILWLDSLPTIRPGHGLDLGLNWGCIVRGRRQGAVPDSGWGGGRVGGRMARDLCCRMVCITGV